MLKRRCVHRHSSGSHGCRLGPQPKLVGVLLGILFTLPQCLQACRQKNSVLRIRRKPTCPLLATWHVSGLYSLRMLSARPNQRARHALWVALGFLCCALIVCASILQVGHIHPDGQAVQSDCALCHTAHLVIQPSIPQSVPPIVRVVAAISTQLQPVHPRHYSVFSLFTRPPPVDVAFA